MKNAFDLGEKLFFNTLIICIISFIYSNIIEVESSNLIIEILFALFFFLINFYYGYKYSLKLKESLIVGLMGAGLGIFLSFFSLCAYFLIENSKSSISFSVLYLSPIQLISNYLSGYNSIVNIFTIITINIFLVVIGGQLRNITNKFLNNFK